MSTSDLVPVATVRAPRLAPGTTKPLQRCIELWLARLEGLPACERAGEAVMAGYDDWRC